MYLRRSPSGERGLKWLIIHVKIRGSHRRSPSGERGLKLQSADTRQHAVPSLPIRGAWIEISSEMGYPRSSRVAPHPGSVD